MRHLAFLSCFCILVVGASTAGATSINPLSDGYTLSVGNTALTNANSNFDNGTGVLTFSDGTATYTFLEASAPSLIDALSITRTCITTNLAGCSSSTISITDASLLSGTLSASALFGASLKASGSGGVPGLVFASTNTGVTAQSALVGYQDTASSTNSPVPEPGTISLVMSGVLGVACAARRRLFRA